MKRKEDPKMKVLKMLKADKKKKKRPGIELMKVRIK